MATQPKNIPAFPLKWPKGTPRTKSPGRSKFAARKVGAAYNEVQVELQRLGAEYVVVSTNVPLRNDGQPYSDPGRMKDPGCAVYFQLEGRAYCLPCDRWSFVEENLYAVAKHVEAMRGMDRWGVGSIEQNFAGFKALTATAGEQEDWWTVLGVEDTASVDAINQAHRKAALGAHPDRGGTADQMARINTARDRALAAKAIA